MKQLKLDRLNLRAPYAVWQRNNGSYCFKTDYDVQVRVEFADCTLIWDAHAYEFGLLNENGHRSPADPKVKATVMAIIEEFFAQNPDILLYQCETGDHKQEARDRLFLRWFNDAEASKKYYIKVVRVEAEGINNIAAMIVQIDNPELETYIKDFDDFVALMTDKPE